MRSFCMNGVTAISLLLTLGSQAFAQNWIFEESTDSSDGRKGVIIYKSEHFDTTLGAFARFIVLDNNTLRLRLRTAATGPMYLLPEIDFAIPVDGKADFAGIYHPAKDASRCVAEPELATGCRLTCARTYEDFSQGEEVACTAKSDDNLWIDFRADFTPEHTDRILKAYSKLVSINFYAGMNDDTTDYTSWYLNADDLLKHICEQTKAADHACRGGQQIAAASEPEQQTASNEYTSGWDKKSRDEFVNIGDGWNFSIEFDPTQRFFSLYASLTTGGNQYGELHSVRLVKSEYDGRGSDYTLYFDLLKMETFYDDDYENDDVEIYTKATCFWPTEGGKISIYSCSATCSSDENCLEIGPRTDISMRSEFPIDLLPNFIRALEHYDKILFQFDGRMIWEEIGDLPTLLKNRGEGALDADTDNGTNSVSNAGKDSNNEVKLPDELTREDVCVIFNVCDDEDADLSALAQEALKELNAQQGTETEVSAATSEPEQQAATKAKRPVCQFRENDMGGFFVYADDEEWRVQIASHNQSSGQDKSLFGIEKYTGHDRSQVVILLDNGSFGNLEHGAETEIVFSGNKFNWSAPSSVGHNDDDYSSYFWSFRFNGGDDEKLQKMISDLDGKGDVEIAVGFRGSDEVIFDLTYPFRGLDLAASLAKSRYARLRKDLENGNCTAVSDFYEDDDDW